MTCGVCRVVRAVVVNLFIWLDVTANLLLGGRPPETISQRLARLRRDGSPRGARVAAWFCAALTRVYGRTNGQDHCDWALNPEGHDGVELWRWSP